MCLRKANFVIVASVLGACLSPPLPAQTFSAQTLSAQTLPALQENSRVAPLVVSDLPLDGARRFELEDAIARRDYKRAETMLVDEIARDPKSTRAAKLLVAVAGIFFLDGQHLNAAIAWKKAEAIAPLDERSKFTLAMAYIRLNRNDWARQELERLAAAEPRNPLYQYWLARLDYHAQEYTAAIVRLQQVIKLDSQMMRAYDSLGLCYDYLGQYDEAIKNYRQAIQLNRQQSPPSPWPHVNLAISLIAVNQLTEAENHLREALGYDAKLPQAHYQLGQVLEKQGRYAEAIESLTQAALLNPAYPEPHYTLGKIYQKQGDKKQATEAVKRFQQLKGKNTHLPTSSAPPH
ncbi:MAG: tetratricopeptide repeat protein [Pyrinomonadaceae bacterium]